MGEGLHTNLDDNIFSGQERNNDARPQTGQRAVCRQKSSSVNYFPSRQTCRVTSKLFESMTGLRNRSNGIDALRDLARDYLPFPASLNPMTTSMRLCRTYRLASSSSFPASVSPPITILSSNTLDCYLFRPHQNGPTSASTGNPFSSCPQVKKITDFGHLDFQLFFCRFLQFFIWTFSTTNGNDPPRNSTYHPVTTD